MKKSEATNYLIFGAGASGLSVVEYCLSQDANVRVIDTRDLPPNAAKIKSLLPSNCVSFGTVEQQWIDQADVLVLSPGVSPHLPVIKQASEQGKEVIGDIELFARNVPKPYIAVTGSNGKSTVTMLVADILASQGLTVKACANIGEPALTAINIDVDLFVLELSSFQLETCYSLSPLAAVVLNITEDHLDRHESFQKYARIKTSIYNNASNKIIPRTDSIQSYFAKHKDAISFGLDVPHENDFGIVEYETGRWLVHHQGTQGHYKIIRTSELSLLGTTGELNVLAALALTHGLIKDYAKAIDAIKCFKGLAHRCELVALHNNVRWIDDSKGTNVGATVSAIEGLGQSLILIVGGVHKGGSLQGLCDAVRDRVNYVIAFGQDRQLFIDALSAYVEVKEAASLDECVECAAQIALPGQTILFSPACASFDMFANYVERGLAFKRMVLEKVNEDD